MDWFISNWLGIASILLTIFFGVVGINFFSRKNSNNSRVSQNINLGDGKQYNAGRDINLRKKDKK